MNFKTIDQKAHKIADSIQKILDIAVVTIVIFIAASYLEILQRPDFTQNQISYSDQMCK